MTTISDVIHDITAERDAARDKTDDSLDELDEQKRAIFAAAAGRDLTEAENARVKAIDAAMRTLFRTDTALELATVEALNQKPQVKSLVQSLETVGKELAQRKTDLDKVAATITKFADAMKAVDGVLQSAMKLVALFP